MSSTKRTVVLPCIDKRGPELKVEASIRKSDIYNCMSSKPVTQEERDTGVQLLQKKMEGIINKVSVNRRVVNEAEGVFKIWSKLPWVAKYLVL